MIQNATITSRPVESASIRCGDHSWGYVKHMHKLTPDFELNMLNIDVIIRDGVPVELQIAVTRKWRDSFYKGNHDSAVLYIRTLEEAKKQGKDDATVWEHDFDPLGSSTVGPNGRHHPVVVDSIEVPNHDNGGGNAGSSGENNSRSPSIYDGVLDPAFLPDVKPMVSTDDMQTMMSEMLKLCRVNGFTPQEAELMFLRLALTSRNAHWRKFDSSGDL